MQVTDRNIGANPTGFDMRTEINNIIAALESDNSGASEPLNTVAYMKWLDTSNATYYYVKERNHDNTAWVTLFRYTVATKIMEAVSNGVILSQTNIASEIHASSSKTTPVDADEIGLIDSASTFTLKKLTWANLKGTLKTYFDTLYVTLSGNQTIADIKTFSSFPITPSSAPTTDYQVSNKKYVDDKTITFAGMPAGSVIQVANYTTGAMATGTALIPFDNTIPQITEGTQFMSLVFTPKKANSKLKIIVNTLLSNSAASAIIIALFKDGGSNAVATTVDNRIPAVGLGGACSFITYIDAVSTSLSTFTVRAGGQTAGTLTFNGFSGAAYFGGSLASSITIEEIAQ